MDSQPAKRLDEYDLVLTARRRDGRVLSVVRGKPTYLPYGLFCLLTDLVEHYRVAPHGYLAGRANAYPMAICRLRRALAQAVGDDVGRQLIQTGLGAEYRLAPQTQVAIDAQCSLAEDAIGAQVLAAAGRLCPRVAIADSILEPTSSTDGKTVERQSEQPSDVRHARCA